MVTVVNMLMSVKEIRKATEEGVQVQQVVIKNVLRIMYQVVFRLTNLLSGVTVQANIIKERIVTLRKIERAAHFWAVTKSVVIVPMHHKRSNLKTPSDLISTVVITMEEVATRKSSNPVKPSHRIGFMLLAVIII